MVDLEGVRAAYHEARDAYEADPENEALRREYLERKQWFGDTRTEWRKQEEEAGNRVPGVKADRVYTDDGASWVPQAGGE